MDRIWEFCALICHQHISHSFTVNDIVFPLCIRCMSLYLSCFIAVIVLWFYACYCKTPVFYTTIKGFFILFFFIFLICIDVFTGYFGFCASNTISRIITGLLCGSSFAILVYIMFSLYFYKKFNFSIRCLSIKELIILIFVISISFFLLLGLFFICAFFFFVMIFFCLIGYILFCFCLICYFLFLFIKLE